MIIALFIKKFIAYRQILGIYKLFKEGEFFLSRDVRTDLVLEAHELIKENEFSERRDPPGVEVETSGDEEIRITRVKVVSPEGEKAIGKPMGNYITLEVPRLKRK